jgi:hypothetical protein
MNRSLASYGTIFFLLLGIAFLAFQGCGRDPLRDVAAKLSKLSVDESQAVTIEDAIAQCSETPTLLIKAKVGAGKGDTFDKKRSEFLVSEIPNDEHASDPNHDPSSCPFCRKRAEKAPTVVIRVIDASGKSLPRSAEELFSLKKGMHVLVQGSGTYDSELNTLTIDANALRVLN